MGNIRLKVHLNFKKLPKKKKKKERIQIRDIENQVKNIKYLSK